MKLRQSIDKKYVKLFDKFGMISIIFGILFEFMKVKKTSFGAYFRSNLLRYLLFKLFEINVKYEEGVVITIFQVWKDFEDI